MELSEILDHIEHERPMYSLDGSIPVIYVRDSNIVIRYTRQSRYNDNGWDIFARHARASLLDDLFVSTKAYSLKHVPEPLLYFKDGDLSGYAYPFTEGQEHFDSMKGGMMVRIDEWPEFKQHMKEAGFDFGQRDFNQGAWAGDGISTQDMIYHGMESGSHLCNNWVVIDFCSNHIRYSRQKFKGFVESQQDNIRLNMGEQLLHWLRNPLKDMPATEQFVCHNYDRNLPGI